MPFKACPCLWEELRIGTNTHDRLTPCLSVTQILQTLRNALETLVDVVKDSRSDLLGGEHVEQCFPSLTDLFRFVVDVGTPVNAGNSDVLEEDKVGRDLFDRSGSEADDDDATVPSDDFERRDDHTDGVVDDVNTVTFGDLCSARKQFRSSQETRGKTLSATIVKLFNAEK